MKTVYILGVLSVLAHAKEYRFDYQWDEQARGWMKYHAVPAVWEDARLRCHAEGAVLASPVTEQLKAAVVRFARKQSKLDVLNIFTGVHATFSKGDYSSIEGVPLLRLAITWAPGEPDNYENSERCLAILVSSNGTVIDTSCNRVLPYVCYKKDTQLTVSKCGTDPEYTLAPETGSCYKFHRRGLIWSEAYRTCIAEGGYLAIINSEIEANIIKEIIAKNPEYTTFGLNHDIISIGFHDWGHHNTNFMTIHGENLDPNYNVWKGGEPNNQTNIRLGSPGEYCGSVFRQMQLNDNSCNAPTAFLCEKIPDSLSIYYNYNGVY